MSVLLNQRTTVLHQRTLKGKPTQQEQQYSAAWWENIHGLIFISYNRNPGKKKKNTDMLKSVWLPLRYVMCKVISCGSAWWSGGVSAGAPKSLTRTWKQSASFTLDKQRSAGREEIVPLAEISFHCSSKAWSTFNNMRECVKTYRWRLKHSAVTIYCIFFNQQKWGCLPLILSYHLDLVWIFSTPKHSSTITYRIVWHFGK